MTNSNFDWLDTRISLISAALALCIKPGEKLINIEQLKMRNFAPTGSFCESCICDLAQHGLVTIETKDPNGQPLEFTSVLSHEKDKNNFVIWHTKKVIRNKSDPSQFAELQAVHREIVALECVEYVKFYANRQSCSVIDERSENAKLQLLCMELKPEKINSLLWRSTKNNIKRSSSNEIHFDGIIDEAFDTFIQLRRRRDDWDGYERPRALKTSAIANLTVFCLSHSTP